MPVRAVTVDVYSALFDTVASLTRAVAEVFRPRGLGEDPQAAARTWRQKHFEYLLLSNSLDREPASNRRAIEAGARYALRRLAPPVEPPELERLVRAWETLDAWPDAVPALAELRRRPLVLAALSNGDEEMLRALLRTLPVPFDHVISTEGGKFKPHPSVYEKARRVLGVSADELLHVAGSPSDALGATAAGIRTVWVNRAGDAVVDPRFVPDHELPDLGSLLPLLSRLSA